jgi:pilus assembly protein Flp/PilA
MVSTLSGFLQNEEGQSITEYGLLLALIAVAVVGAIATFGNSVFNEYDGSAQEIVNAMS